MRRRIGIALVLCSGCGDRSAAGIGASGSGDTGPITATSSSSAEESSGADFVTAPDGGSLTQCDLYADACPSAQKCVPYASDGGSKADATRCVVVSDDPGALDAGCTVQSWIASGLDDCARGLFCAVYDAAELSGRCLALCVADPEQDDLTCFDPNARCVGPPDTLPRLCASDCDPFGSDCPAGRSCYRVDDHFVCLDDVSGKGGGYGDSCFFTNECDPAMLCADPPEFFECPYSDGCCTPLCDTRDPDASAMCLGAPEHVCVSLFDAGEGSPLFDWVGACVVPSANEGP
jgi:hypothetical protein